MVSYKARSCLTNLLCFFEEITKCVDDGSPVDVIYLDFQKAFDKVPHQRLILKLKSLGMGNSIINWIEQWLTDRRQRVVVDGEASSGKSVLSGVPQGSVLGPILFLVYINDVTLAVPRSRTNTYGDRCFPKAAALLWNSLPASLRDTNSIASFQRGLTTFLFRQ